MTQAAARDPQPREIGHRTSEEYNRFERLTKRLLSVPKKEIQDQEKKPR